MRFIKPCKRLIHFENFLNTLPKVRKTNFESSMTTDDMFVAFQQRKQWIRPYNSSSNSKSKSNSNSNSKSNSTQQQHQQQQVQEPK